MLDNLNIRKLYENILNERAIVNGVVILENVTIPSNRSNPDKINFDGESYDYDLDTRAFSFIGGDNKLLYTIQTHPYIFNALRKAVRDSKNAATHLKSYNVKSFDKIDEGDLSYFYDKQMEQAMGDTRIKTGSGRIWLSVNSKNLKREVSVVAFWGKQKSITNEMINKIKKCFKVEDLFWVATDSKNYIYHGDTYQDFPNGEIKELRSKIYPELKHDQIVDILMRAHSGFQMTPFEKKVVWEFRGFDPSEVKRVTGGYPSVAEYEYRKKLSESNEL